jgi:CBS domain containing-hemolysin-like protein
MEEMRDVISSSHHTRYPVCMDDKDNIIGFIHVKDFFESMASGEKNTKSIMRNILTVPEVMPASKLLQLMRTRRIYFAVVVDEYGTTAGLVTLEDIMEELVGEIQQEKDPEGNSVVKHEDGSFEFDGMVILDDVEELLGIEFEEEGGANTIGGYVFGVLERIPKVGDVVDIQGWRFRVLRMDGFRIVRLKADREMPEEEKDKSENRA